jgi:hypothetical protein
VIEEGYTAPARGGGGGRPTKKTPKRCRAILAGIEAGWPYVVACRCAGVSYDVFKLWCRTDDRFAQEVQLAEAQAIQANLDTIKAASRDNWPAAAWLLERRHPEMFSKPEVQLNLAVQQNLNTAERSISLELVVIKDLEFLALQKHPDYTHHPNRSPVREVEVELSGTLTKKGVNGQIISQSEAKAIETQAESVNQRVRQMFRAYRPALGNGDQDGSGSVSMSVQEKFANYRPEGNGESSAASS